MDFKDHPRFRQEKEKLPDGIDLRDNFAYLETLSYFLSSTEQTFGHGARGLETALLAALVRLGLGEAAWMSEQDPGF